MNAKSKLGPIAIASIMLLLAAQVAFAQVDWTWGTLEVPPGDPGSWDPGRHLMGDVVFDGTTWHMYLVGGPGDEPVAYRWKVGHWTWNDLTLEWEEDPANPVLEPDSGHWDAYSIGSVAVLHQGGMFHMWYGAAGVHLDPTYVGYATSSDGSLWIKDLGNPVAGLGPGSAGAWDDHGTAPHTVLVEGSSLRMWFFAFQGGYGGVGTTWRIGHARSPTPMADSAGPRKRAGSSKGASPGRETMSTTRRWFATATATPSGTAAPKRARSRSAMPSRLTASLGRSGPAIRYWPPCLGASGPIRPR